MPALRANSRVVDARLDPTAYPTKLKVTKDQIADVNITGHEFHPEWNYRITPANRLP